MALSANEGLKTISIDICTAFLPAKVLDQAVFMDPPKDLRKQGNDWRLIKQLYGLDNAS